MGQQPQVYLEFNGIDNYVEVPDSEDFSVSTRGKLTVAAWMKPDPDPCCGYSGLSTHPCLQEWHIQKM